MNTPISQITVGLSDTSTQDERARNSVDNIDLYKYLKTSNISDRVQLATSDGGLIENRSGDEINLALQLYQWWLSDDTGLKDVLTGLLSGYVAEALTKNEKRRVNLKIYKQNKDGSSVKIDLECDKASLKSIEEILKNALN